MLREKLLGLMYYQASDSAKRLWRIARTLCRRLTNNVYTVSGSLRSKHYKTLRCTGSFARYARISSIVAGMFFGVILGLALHSSRSGKSMTPENKYYLKFAGQLYVRMLRLVIVPLVIGTHVTTVRLLPRKITWRVTLIMLAGFTVSVITAEAIAISVAVVVKPGERLNISENAGRLPPETAQGVASFLNLIRNLVPNNVILAMFQKDMVYLQQQYRTVNEEGKSANLSDAAQQKINEFAELYKNSTAEESEKKVPGLEVSAKAAQTNLLGLLSFSLLVGIGLRKLGKDVATLTTMFQNLQQVMIFIVTVVIWFAPVGSMLLVAYNLATIEDFSTAARIFIAFILSEFAGLAIYSFVVLPVAYFVLIRTSPLRFIAGCTEAYLNALGTASSEATLPVTIYCMDTWQTVSEKRISRYCIAYGCVLHMPGTAIHQTLITVFFAQLMGIDLAFTDHLLLILGSYISSSVTPGVERGAQGTTESLLEFLGIPHFGDSKLLNIVKPVDWVLDRARTMTNVHANCMLTAIITRLLRGQLIACEATDDEKLCDILQAHIDRPERIDEMHSMHATEKWYTILRKRRRFLQQVDVNLSTVSETVQKFRRRHSSR